MTKNSTIFTNDDITSAKVALSVHLDIFPSDQLTIEVESYAHYGLIVLSYEGEEYAVALSDNAANRAAAAYISDTVWAFSPYFMVAYLPKGFDVDSVKMIQEAKCEDCNELFYNLIAGNGDWYDFIDDAISADGRGNFLSSYDGEEHEVGDTFLYQIG